MIPPKRREPSRMMASMADRVESTRSKLLTADSEFSHSFEIEVPLVEADLSQARKAFDETSIELLADSLREQGQLQPILVRRHPDKRGCWIIVAGERRWRAAVRLGWKVMLAIEHGGPYEVASLVENLQRVDLSIVEEATALRRLIEINGWSQRVAAKTIGRSLSDLNGLLKLLELPTNFLEGVLNSEHTLSRNLLIELARVPNGPGKDRLLNQALTRGLTIADIRQRSSDHSDDSEPKESALQEAPVIPELGGRRRLDHKAILRFHKAFSTSETSSFPDEERNALILFANEVRDRLGTKIV